MMEKRLVRTLPRDKLVCRLLLEYRANIYSVLGKKCFHGWPIPLALLTIFGMLFGMGHPLAGRNHDALVDSQQLALMAKLFFDLCHSPGQKILWKNERPRDLPPRAKEGTRLLEP